MSAPHFWPQVPRYTGQRLPASGYASHLRNMSAAALLLASLPAAANDAYIVTATLLVPAKGEPLRQRLPPDTVLRALSLADCELVHAPRIAAEKAAKHAADVRRTGGRVVAECKVIGGGS